MSDTNTSWIYITTQPNKSLIRDILSLASYHTKIGIMCKTSERQDHVDVHIDRSKSVSEFEAEFERLSGIMTEPLNEPILPDDHPVHQGFMYIADGRPREFIDGMNMTVGRWKKLPGNLAVSEVRRCDLATRIVLLLPKKLEPVQDIRKGVPFAVHHHGDRRRRKTHKIRKAS